MKVLIVGANFLSVEIARQLPGNFYVTILDDTFVESKEETHTLDESAVGKKCVEVHRSYMKNVQKCPEINWVHRPIESTSFNFYKEFNVLVATTELSNQALILDEICRECRIRYIYAAVFGQFGFILQELLCMFYVSSFKYILRKTVDKPIVQSYILFKVFHIFADKYDRKPNIVKYDSDFEELLKITNEVAELMGLTFDEFYLDYLDIDGKKNISVLKNVATDVCSELKNYHDVAADRMKKKGCIKFYHPLSKTYEVTEDDFTLRTDIAAILKAGQE